MIALGIRGDQPLDPEQPPLVDGVHLRWSPEQELGFPWHGFYLFRRETRPSRPRCLKKELVENPPRPGNDPRYVTAIGTLSSPKPLVFTDDFPDPGVVEADLSAPLRFDLPPGVETERVDLRIGFRDTPRLVRTCVDFRLLPLGSGPTPRTEEGAVFSVQPVNVVTQAPDAAIEQWNSGPAGLEFTSPVRVTYRLDIALPCRATKVDLLLSNRDAIVVQAFAAGGLSKGIRRFDARALQASPVTLSGKAIDRVTIESTSVDSALLHEICWECPTTGGDGTSDGPEVRVDFTSHGLQEFPNPVVDQGVTFESQEVPGTRAPLAWFLRAQKIGLHVRRRVEIRLPCATARAEMLVTKMAGGPPATITAFRHDGSVAQQVEITTFGESTVAVAGDAITHIRIDAYGEDLLHTLSFRCRGKATQTILVRGFSYDQEVTQLDVTAEGSQIAATLLTAEALTAIEIEPGKAALIDLCYTPTRQPVPFGWEPVPGFQYPLCLPVAHRDYPCASKPANPDAARNLALSRVTYPSPPEREQGFWKLHRELVYLVRGGPAGGPMADRTHARLRARPHSPATQESPSVPDLKPLDLILLASLHPAYAQMLGLYFVDRDVAPGIAYDYLILADPTGVLGGSAKTALEWLAHDPDSKQVHTELLLDRRAEPRPPIAPPAGARAHALPGAAAREVDGSVPEVAGNVGLWWPLPPETDEEEPDRIIFYDVRRAFFGPTRPGSAPDASQYQRVPRLRAILVSEPDPPPPPADPHSRSSDWPPPTIAMHAVDGNLAEGWYSFRIAGQDLFGRRSVPGLPAEWHQWDPPAGTPLPWYWKTPAGYRSIDSFAVGLLDKVPPPTPMGVEAWALDPDDRWLFADAQYEQWRAKVPPALIGLRVRWRWTHMQQIQAPDTGEFRVYWQPGRWNAILGNIDSVSAAGADQSYALLDIADGHSVDAFQGARLRVDDDDFAILGSDTVGPQLRLRVKNIGANDKVRPAAGTACTIAIPHGHALFVDTSRPSSWAKRLVAVPYDPPLATVVDASKDANGELLTSDVFTAPLVVSGDTVRLPAPANLSGIQPWIDHLWLKDAGGAEETRRIVRYDTALRTVTLESTVTLVPARWIVGRPAREYEIFLPAPDVGPNAPFEPTLTETAVYAQVAVSAADDKLHVVDTWPLGTRPGNESPLSPSATVYRVWQKPPDPPELPDLADRLWATPADWHDRSYSTFRFLQSEHLRVHVLRALDDTLFQRDWLIRETRAALDPVVHAEYFPDDMPGPARTAVAVELNTFTDHASLSVDALKVLAFVPGNEGAAKLAERDALIRHTRKTLSAADTVFSPKSWTPATRDAVATELNAIATPADYETLSFGALRILAGLPGNEAAFTQVTLEPLEMNAPAILDERRPDDDAQYTSADSNIRAYTDTLPGRATNRYFYRAAFVDPAQNISALSLAGPPVYLRKVEPPRTPVITRVVGGERQITIKWAANREPGLAGYRVYRAGEEYRAADPRTMDLVHSAGAADLEWTDDANLIPGRKYFYRMAAVDTSENESTPTRIHPAIAVDTRVPPAPDWIEQTWLLRRAGDRSLVDWPADNVVPPGHEPVLRLGFRSQTPEPQFVVTRWRTDRQNWVERPRATIAPGANEAFTFHMLDDDVDPTIASAYRLKVRSSSGVWATDDALITITPPEGVEAVVPDEL